MTEDAAEVYAAALSFMRAAKAANDVDAATVGAELRRAPLKDTLFGTATVRQDGRVLYDLNVYRVKPADQIQRRWAYYTRIAAVPAAQAFPPDTCAGADADPQAAKAPPGQQDPSTGGTQSKR